MTATATKKPLTMSAAFMKKISALIANAEKSEKKSDWDKALVGAEFLAFAGWPKDTKLAFNLATDSLGGAYNTTSIWSWIDRGEAIRNVPLKKDWELLGWEGARTLSKLWSKKERDRALDAIKKHQLSGKRVGSKLIVNTMGAIAPTPHSLRLKNKEAKRPTQHKALEMKLELVELKLEAADRKNASLRLSGTGEAAAEATKAVVSNNKALKAENAKLREENRGLRAAVERLEKSSAEQADNLAAFKKTLLLMRDQPVMA